MTKLFLLIGLPGSGKSFLAQQLVAERCQLLPLISTDTIRAQLFGGETIQGSWQLIWQQIQLQFQQAVEQISTGQVPEAIYDATNANPRHRREVVALARTTGFTHLTGLWMDTPLQLCLERNSTRPRQVPEEIILAMHQQLLDAPPSLSDGLDCLIRYSSASTEIAIHSPRNNRTRFS